MLIGLAFQQANLHIYDDDHVHGLLSMNARLSL
jgi:hypothetical protein